MIVYACLKCNRVFNRKDNLEIHINKNACKQYTHYCKFCKKGFTTETSMYRHVRTSCKIKKEDDSAKDKIYERLIEMEEKVERFTKANAEMAKEHAKIIKKNKQLTRIIKKIEHMPTVKGNNNNININTGIVNNTNIILVGYGKEDLSKIDKKEILRAIQSGYDSTINLTETLHFNPKHPEYHNIYITNVKNKYAMMFDGTDWNLTMKDELINKIYDDKKNYIEENIDEFVESLSISRKKALDRWLETDDEDDKISKIKNEIKLLLYNKRNLILDDIDDIKKPNQFIRLTAKKAKKMNTKRWFDK
jgi:hypothetical protein